jgi:hypothetical protein
MALYFYLAFPDFSTGKNPTITVTTKTQRMGETANGRKGEKESTSDESLIEKCLQAEIGRFVRPFRRRAHSPYRPFAAYLARYIRGETYNFMAETNPPA